MNEAVYCNICCLCNISCICSQCSIIVISVVCITWVVSVVSVALLGNAIHKTDIAIMLQWLQIQLMLYKQQLSTVSLAAMWYLLSVWHWSDIQSLKHDGDISGHCYLVLFRFLLFRWLGKTIGYRNVLRRAFRLHQKIGGGARGFLCFLLLLGLLQKVDMFISSEITSSQTQ